MRSLWYRLTHRPANLDDCLHLAGMKPVKGARLRLRYSELIREQWLLIHLLAILEVEYEGEDHAVEVLCGGYLDVDSEESKRAEFVRANGELKKLVRKLAEQGIVLSNSDEEFKYIPPPKREQPARKRTYAQLADKQAFLRDRLAIDRTILANERTILAYCRTGLALVITGAGCIKFFHSPASDVVGWALISLGLVVTVVGAWRFATMRQLLGTARKGAEAIPSESALTDAGPQPGPNNRIDLDTE